MAAQEILGGVEHAIIDHGDEDEQVIGVNEWGVMDVPDIKIPPPILRYDDEDDDALPIVPSNFPVPLPLIANLTRVDPKNLSEIKFRKNGIKKSDKFNDLGQNIPRDIENCVTGTRDLIEKMNKYEFQGDGAGYATGVALTVLSLGMRAAYRRYTVEPGYFGHYRDKGRDKLLPPGIHSLTSSSIVWIGMKPIDDEETNIRKFGSKTIITVPENFIGGAKKIGSKNGINVDGDFVIFEQGRHVLNEDEYSDIVLKKLEGNVIKIGPLTVMYVREGYIGGALERNTGRFKIFMPGPPYLMHEKDYQDIECVERTVDDYKIGPIKFLNVKDGQLGGAIHKHTGYYQVLPPGNTYILHEKDYASPKIQNRCDSFKLGPYFFLTVRQNRCAGAYKKRGGRFIDLPPGRTYQLNEEDYFEPICVEKKSHKYVCGPKTYLTVKKGTLNGAYRKVDGQFEIFDKEDKQYILDTENYQDPVSINMVSNAVQEFGPYKVITIPPGYSAVFKKRGIMEIKEAGFYTLEAEYEILPAIPMKIFTNIIENLPIITKDSLQMSLSANISYSVKDPMSVALYPGSFIDIQNSVLKQLQAIIKERSRTFNRVELFPTKQDVVVSTQASADVELKEDDIDILVAKGEEHKNQCYLNIAKDCQDRVNSISMTSRWGVSVDNITIFGLELKDEQILEGFKTIAQELILNKNKKAQAKIAEENAKIDAQQISTEERRQMVQLETEHRVIMQKKLKDAERQREEAEIEANLRKQHATNQEELEKRTELHQQLIRKQKALAEVERVREEEIQRAIAHQEKQRKEQEIEKERTIASAEIERNQAIKDAEIRKQIAIAKKEEELIATEAQNEVIRTQKEYEAKIAKIEADKKYELKKREATADAEARRIKLAIQIEEAKSQASADADARRTRLAIQTEEAQTNATANADARRIQLQIETEEITQKAIAHADAIEKQSMAELEREHKLSVIEIEKERGKLMAQAEAPGYLEYQTKIALAKSYADGLNALATSNHPQRMAMTEALERTRMLMDNVHDFTGMDPMKNAQNLKVTKIEGADSSKVILDGRKVIGSFEDDHID